MTASIGSAAEHGIVVIGGGSIGGLVAAKLHMAGQPVALVGRGKSLEAIRTRGLDLEFTAGEDGEPGSTVTGLKIPAFASAAEAVRAVGHPRAVVFTVKAFDLPAAAAELASLSLAPAPVAVCLENGIGSEEVLAHWLPEAPIVAGVITYSADRPAPGRILVQHGGGIALGPYRASGSPGARLARPLDLEALKECGWVKALEAAGFELRFYDRGDSIKWSKLLLNLWASASVAVFDLPASALVADPKLFGVDYHAFREALRVMAKDGVPAVNLPKFPVRLLTLLGRLLPEAAFRRLLGSKVAGGRGGKMSSLWIDLKAGRPKSEVSVLQGAIASTGRRLGVATPVNAALAAALEILFDHR